MAIIIVILMLLGTLAFFYLKCSMMQSLTMLWSSVIAMILTFSYYEVVAELFISRGYGLQWAHVGCFLIVFIVSFTVLRSVSEFVIRAKIDLGQFVTVVMGIVCGLLTGVIFSGVLLVAFGLLPMQGALFYNRFDPDKPVVISHPSRPLLNVDGFVNGLYTWISSGSLSSSRSFGVLHADYLSQIHLNKLKTKDDVLPVSSREALVLPKGKVKKPIRVWDIPDVGQMTVVRVGIVSRKIEDGGANNPTGKLILFPAQIRLIARDEEDVTENRPFTGLAKAVYPSGFLKDGIWDKVPLDEILVPDSKEMDNRIYWVDVAFDVPTGHTPILLEFRNNAVVDLTTCKPVKTSQEIEEALNSEEPQASSS